VGVATGPVPRHDQRRTGPIDKSALLNHAEALPLSKRKLSYNEQRELEALPGKIEALEAEQERLRRDSESPDFYMESTDHIKAVLARLEALGSELESTIARWMELEERRS
jgi:ATP-binding cassette subfamily F protein uup